MVGIKQRELPRLTEVKTNKPTIKVVGLFFSFIFWNEVYKLNEISFLGISQNMRKKGKEVTDIYRMELYNDKHIRNQNNNNKNKGYGFFFFLNRSNTGIKKSKGQSLKP